MTKKDTEQENKSKKVLDVVFPLLEKTTSEQKAECYTKIAELTTKIARQIAMARVKGEDTDPLREQIEIDIRKVLTEYSITKEEYLQDLARSWRLQNDLFPLQPK